MTDTDADSPPDPIKKMQEDVVSLALADQWRKVRRAIEEGELTDMGFWQTAPGCALLRELAYRAVRAKELTMVKYLIETMGVPGHGLFEVEKADMSPPVARGRFTPFTGLHLKDHEEEGMAENLAYLFSLPAESVDVRYCTPCLYERDGLNINLLHLFAMDGNRLQVARHLVLDRGMDVCEVDDKGYLPIYRAVAFGDYTKGALDMVQFLFEQHALRGQSYADICRLLPEGVSLLAEAIKKHNHDMVQLLVEEMGGALERMPSKYTGSGSSLPVHCAAIFFDDPSAFDYLLSAVPLDLRQVEECLRYALSHAILHKDKEDKWLAYVESLAGRLGPELCRSVKESVNLQELESSSSKIFGLGLLVDPVMASDGHSYQRKELEAWRDNCAGKGPPFSSPKTSAELSPFFFPNHALRALVQDYVVKERSKRKEERQQQKRKKEEGLAAAAGGKGERGK
jgi:hypothetical protein